MSAVELQIVEPAHDKAFFGDASVTFRGAITLPLPDALAEVTLYYRWYSSLFAGDATNNRFSINEVALTSPDSPHTKELGVGTHVISFAAIDQPGETAADLEAAQHGGVTGGSVGEGQCLIHVFKANIVAPLDGGTLHKATDALEAEAPMAWGKPVEEDSGYEPNLDYDKVNRLQYRWVLVPTGAPPGRHTITLIPTLVQLTFDPETDPVVIRYSGPFPADLDGNYTLNLYVEDKQGTLGGHQASIAVLVEP